MSRRDLRRPRGGLEREGYDFAKRKEQAIWKAVLGDYRKTERQQIDEIRQSVAADLLRYVKVKRCRVKKHGWSA